MYIREKYSWKQAAQYMCHKQWVCPGTGWHWLCWTWGKLLATSHRSHPFSPPSTKYLANPTDLLIQGMEESMRKGVLLDLILPARKDWLEMWIMAWLGYSNHEIMEFSILWGGIRAIGKIITLEFRRANFGLFRDLLGWIPWKHSLEGRGVQ